MARRYFPLRRNTISETSSGSDRELAAAAVLESPFGAGSRLIHFSPGNIRLVDDHPAETVVVRRADLVEAIAAGAERARLVSWLSSNGREVVYTPEAMAVVEPAPVFREHLASVRDYARSRAAATRVSALGR